MRAQLLAAAVLLTLPGIAHSQTARQQDDIRFRAMDRNGDGVITRDEWRGSAQSFRVHDWNNDGVLSGDEVRRGASRRDRDEQDYDVNADFNNWTPRGFTSMDHNGDGRITRDEWHFNPEGFNRADRNRNGSLSRAEFLGEGTDDDRDDRFDYLDADNNGRIERDEWHGGQQEFRWLDRNGDGVLTRNEVADTAIDQHRNDMFASLDTNRNGTISFNEWHWSRRSFDQRDENGDGVISRNEFGEAGPVGTSGQGGFNRTLTVSATERWSDSGITVRRGDILQIDATGRVTMSSESDAATPSGASRRAPEAPLPQQPAGALIMRINESQPILIGVSRTVRAPIDGRVYFGVNDDYLQDNSGEYRVNVRVQR